MSSREMEVSNFLIHFFRSSEGSSRTLAQGSFPFIAPEVMETTNYTLLCDIYSFGQVFLMLAIKSFVGWNSTHQRVCKTLFLPFYCCPKNQLGQFFNCNMCDF